MPNRILTPALLEFLHRTNGGPPLFYFFPLIGPALPCPPSSHWPSPFSTPVVRLKDSFTTFTPAVTSSLAGHPIPHSASAMMERCRAMT